MLETYGAAFSKAQALRREIDRLDMDEAEKARLVETLEYQIEEEEDGVRKTKEKGEISCREIPGRSRESRFAALNEMSLSLKVNNETALREKMREYQKRDAAVSALFPIV